MAKFNFPANAAYSTAIDKLNDTDPASATNTFNPLFQKLITNIHALKNQMASGNLTVPRASATALGGIKVGSNLSINAQGVLSAIDTTYSAATPTADGLMSAADKAKLDDAASLESPTFTGSPKAPTKPTTDNSTNIATTAFVKNALAENGGGFKAQATPPENASFLWIDTSVGGVLKYHDGTSWVATKSVWG